MEIKQRFTKDNNSKDNDNKSYSRDASSHRLKCRQSGHKMKRKTFPLNYSFTWLGPELILVELELRRFSHSGMNARQAIRSLHST